MWRTGRMREWITCTGSSWLSMEAVISCLSTVNHSRRSWREGVRKRHTLLLHIICSSWRSSLLAA